MAAAVELATAYITVAASGDDLAPSLGRSFKAVEKVAGDSGKRMGKALTGQVGKATEDDVKKAREAYEQASKKVTATVERQAVKVENAKRKEEIAQAKVNEAQSKAEAALAGVTEAQKRAADAQTRFGSESKEALAAQKKLTDEQARYEAGTTQVLSAQDRLALSSQKVEAAQAEQRSATERANRELGESEKQLRDTERAAEAAATPFERLGDRIKSAMRGDFKGAFKPVEREGENAAEEIERDFKRSGDDSAKGFGASFKAGFAGALGGLGAYVGIQEVFDWGKYAVSGAADLEQSIGGVQTVFKDSADQMLSWSDAADQTLGLTANEYNEFAAKLGASLKNAGTPMDELGGKTNDLITMGADLASLYGGTTAEAVDALGSALRGEMDPIERYGISLNDAALTAEGLAMGIEKSGGSFTNQQKQLITMSLLQKQSADATGNFAREQDTASNVAQRLTAKLKDTAAELGSRLTPYLADLGGWILDKGIPALEEFGEGIGGIWSILASGDFKGASSTFGLEEDSGVVDFLFRLRDAALSFGDILTNSVIPGIQGVVQWLKENQAWLVPVAAGILAIVGAWKLYQTWLLIVAGVTKAYAAVQAALNAVMAMNPIGLIVLAIIGLAAAFVVAYKRSETFRNIVNSAWASIKDAAGAVADWFMTHVWPVMKAVWDGISAGAIWLYQNAILPAWNGIKAAVAATVDWLVNTAWPFMQMVWDGIAAAAVWLWQDVLVPAWAGISAAIGAVVDWLVNTAWPFIKGVWDAIAGAAIWLWQTIIQPVWTGIKTAIAIAVTAILVYIDLLKWYWENVLAPVAMWLWHNVIQPVWEGIKAAIGAVVDWIVNTAWPLIKSAWDAIAGAAQWLYQSVILPVWNAIKAAIDAVVSWLVNTAWPVVKQVIDWYAGGFKWLYESVILPVWNAIKGAINAVVQWLMNTAWPFISNVIGWIKYGFNVMRDSLKAAWAFIRDNVISPVVTWLRDVAWAGVISPTIDRIKAAFNVMRDSLRNAWAFIRDNVIQPVATWFRDTIWGLFDRATKGITDAFNVMKDAVQKAWNGIRDTAKVPVEFVVNKIINDAIIGNYNDVANGVFGLDKVDPVSLPSGWARGGILPGYMPMHRGDDVLTPMRSGEGVLVSEGLRDSASQRAFLGANEAAKRGMSFADWLGNGYAGGGLVKLGSPFSGSYPRGDGFGARGGRHKGIDWPMPSGAILKAVAAGKVSHTWNPNAGKKLELSIGNGLVAGYHHLSSYIAGRGEQVGAGAAIAKVGSTGRSSGPHLHFSLRKDGKYVDPAPYLGAGGEAGSGDSGSWWNPFAGLWDSLKARVREGVGDSAWGDALFELPRKILGGAVDWAADKLTGIFDVGTDSGGGAGGAERWRGLASTALSMKGQMSSTNLSSMLRRMNQESSGDPNAYNGWDSNAAAGNASRGLMQVIPSTFRAYAEPGYGSNIYDPLSNMLASINYTLSRYGSLTKGWDRAGGYAFGGIVDGGIFDTGGVLESGAFALNLSGRPEVVLNPAESRAYMAGQASTGAPARGGDTWNIYGADAEDAAEKTFRKFRRLEALRAK